MAGFFYKKFNHLLSSNLSYVFPFLAAERAHYADIVVRPTSI